MAVDTSGVACVTIGYNGATGDRTYVNEGVWDPATCYGSALMLHGDFRTILEATGSPSEPPAAVFTEQEITALKHQAANPSPFNLSVEDGMNIGWLIVGAWAVAWAIKQLAAGVRSATEPD